MDANLAKDVYIRDGWKCRNCKSRNNLMAHHVVFRSHQGPDALNNLLTLCSSCHRGLHDGKLELLVITTTETDLTVKFSIIGNWKPC